MTYASAEGSSLEKRQRPLARPEGDRILELCAEGIGGREIEETSGGTAKPQKAPLAKFKGARPRRNVNGS